MTISHDELLDHLYYLQDFPDAIPYVTSYYKKHWGFCLTYNNFITDFIHDSYVVNIKSDLKDGILQIGEVFIPGDSDDEILFSTYLCHPSMANNELSGPCVALALIRWLELNKPKFSYRFLFLPETIGSICYLSSNLEKLRSNLVCGFNLTCLGDNAPFTYVPTPYSNTYTDKVLSFFLTQLYPNHNIYSWLDRGSDERQYCSPHINLPVCTVTRSKFHVYPEYHTDLDNLNFVSSEGLYTSFDFFTQLILFLEANCSPIATYPCEPFLLKYGLSSSSLDCL